MAKLGDQHEHKMKMANDDWIVIPDVCGPSWWAILHNTVMAIKTDGCESCGGHAVKMMSFLHDMVNADLDKKVYDPKNVLGFKKLTEKLFKQANKQLGNGPRKLKAGNSVSDIENTEPAEVKHYKFSSVTSADTPCNTTLENNPVLFDKYWIDIYE